MRFVPEGDLNTMKKEGKNQVKILITDHVSKSFELFSEGGPEAVIMLIRSDESIVKERKLRGIYKSASAPINTKVTVISKLDRVNDNILIKEMNKAIDEPKATCISTQEYTFDYFEQ